MEEQQQAGGMSPEHQPMAPGVGGPPYTGSPPVNENRGEFQDYPGMEDEQPPLISGNLSDIARWGEKS